MNIFRSWSKVIDFRIGFAGGLVMGIVVYLINYYSTGNLTGSLTAALKQAVYTFFFGGLIMKMSENIAIWINPKTLAIILSMVVPSIVSLGLTFGLHSLKGTPKPLESTIPTAIFVIPSTLIWGIINRKRKESATKQD